MTFNSGRHRKDKPNLERWLVVPALWIPFPAIVGLNAGPPQTSPDPCSIFALLVHLEHCPLHLPRHLCALFHGVKWMLLCWQNVAVNLVFKREQCHCHFQVAPRASQHTAQTTVQAQLKTTVLSVRSSTSPKEWANWKYGLSFSSTLVQINLAPGFWNFSDGIVKFTLVPHKNVPTEKNFGSKLIVWTDVLV